MGYVVKSKPKQKLLSIEMGNLRRPKSVSVSTGQFVGKSSEKFVDVTGMTRVIYTVGNRLMSGE